MDLRTLIGEATESLDSARFELSALLAAIEEQRQIIVDLEDEIHGLRLAASRRGETLEDEEPAGNVVNLHGDIEIPASKAASLEGMSRSDAVAHVLSMQERPLDRQGIQTRMQTLGRVGDTLDQISLALTNLKRSGRALRVGEGRWRGTSGSAQVDRSGL